MFKSNILDSAWRDESTPKPKYICLILPGGVVIYLAQKVVRSFAGNIAAGY